MRTGVVEGMVKYTEHSPASLFNNIVRRNMHTKFRVVQITLVVLDILALVVSFALAYNIRFIASTTNLFDATAYNDVNFYLQFMLILVPVWIALFFVDRKSVV